MKAKTAEARLEDSGVESRLLQRRHLRAGWVMLCIFLTLGLTLESLHGWKVRWYLDLANETRRLMFTLAHAHGTLIGLLHVAFSASLASLRSSSPRAVQAASRCLILGGGLLPVGFLLGGFFLHAGDPGVGVFIVPVGALLLIAAAGLCARAAFADRVDP